MNPSISTPALFTSASDPLQAFLSSLSEFQSTDRIEALYSDFSSSRYSNPAGYSANVATWARIFHQVLRLGLQPTPSDGSTQIPDRLVLHVNDRLLDGLRRPGIGRPYGLHSPITALSTSSSSDSQPTLVLRSEFMSTSRSMLSGPSLPYSILASAFRSLFQAVGGSYFDAEQRLDRLDLDQRWTAVKTDWAHLPLISEAADNVIRLYKSSSGTISQLDRLFTLQQFREELASHLFSETEASPISSADTTILLRHLQRDRCVLVSDGQIIKFVPPEQIGDNGQAIAGPPHITESDAGIVSVRETINQLNQQISSIEKRIQQQTEQAREYLAKSRKEPASSCLRARKMLNELLSRRLGTLETLQTVYMKIEQASSDVEIMAAYETSASTLKTLLASPALKIERVDRTMEDLQHVLADEAEVRNAISSASVGGAEIDEDEILAELAGLVAEQTPAKQVEPDMNQLEHRLKALSVPENHKEEETRVALPAS